MNTQSEEKRILFVGGGTGGHFYPLIALAEKINAQEHPPKLYFAGPDKYDAEALKQEKIAFVKIWSGKQRRYRSILNIFDIFKVFFGTFSALIKLYFLYPDVIVSKGGYTSVPIIIAGAILRIPIVVHESDSVVGKANRLGLRFARLFITTYSDIVLPKSKARIENLGIPIRTSLFTEPSPQSVPFFNEKTSTRPIIFIIGGSQGAERINELVLDSLDELLIKYTVVHQTGKSNYDTCVLSAQSLIPNDNVREYYLPTPFLGGEALNSMYHYSSIIISRAGSTSIYEIALHGKPSIIIPIPEKISHDQRSNAYAYARSGAGVVIEEGNLTDSLLQAEIERIMNDATLYKDMSSKAKSFANPDAAAQLTTQILELAQQH